MITFCRALVFLLFSIMIDQTYAKPSEAKGQAQKKSTQNIVIVRKGENLVAVAARCKSTTDDLIKTNNLQKPYQIYIGQPLKFNTSKSKAQQIQQPRPAVITHPSAPQISKPKVESISKQSPSSSATPAPISEKTERSFSLLPQVKEKQPLEEEPAQKEEVAAAQPEIKRTGKNFSWPVTGKIISGFGTKKLGLKNDGINIVAQFQTPVKAAEDGVVAYAGNEIRGFGNLILLKHAGGWTSTYAHNDILLVAKGDIIKRGQVIAKSGNTGHVDTPQVHFELRHKSKPVDPLKHLE